MVIHTYNIYVKKALLLFTLGVLLLLGSCVKDAPAEEVVYTQDEPCPAGYERLDICFETDNSKTQLSGTSVKWESSDKVIVNGDTYSIRFEGKQAYIEVKKASSYEAFYPAQLWENGKLYVQPAQFYRSGSFGALANPMYAKSDGVPNLQFHHLMGMLKLKVMGTGSISSISVTDNEGGDVCGYYAFFNDDISPVSGSVQFPSVVLNCKTKSNSGISLTSEGTDFHIVMPARTYSKGITIIMETVDGHSMTINSTTPRTIAKGSILVPPAITFSYPSDQIYEYHLDNLVLGSDPVAGKLGFRAENSAAMTGFEYLTKLTEDINEDGTVDLSTSGTNGDFGGLGKTHAYSRNIQSFTKVHRTRECHGYFACGTGHSAKASFKFPALTNMGSGIHKVEYTFRMAFQNGHKPDVGIQLLHTTSTPGKMLELWIDGVNVTGTMDNNMRWCSTSDTDGKPKLNDASHSEERLLVCPSDFGKDFQWHDVKVVMGAVTSKTVFEFSAFGSTADQPWYIDDISARKLEYSDELSAVKFITPSETSTTMGANDALMPSIYINPFSSTAMDKAVTYTKLYGLKYIDVSISASTIFNSYGVKSLEDADWAKFDNAVSTAVSKLTAAGLKVWSIHLPYSALKEGNVSDENAFEFCSTDSTTRNAAVNRTEVIIKHLAPFAPKYWMVHTTYHHNWDFDGYTSTGWWLWEEKTYYKDCGVLSFKDLVDYVETVKYSDGTTGTFTIENIANTGDYSDCLAGKIDNLVWFCDQCPGLGICIDTGHAVVNGINASDGDFTSTMEKACEKGYLKHLHVHGNFVGNNKDVHLTPGYKPGLFKSSFSTTDTIDWGKLYKALIDNGYRGAFTYELSSPLYDGDFRDCIASYPNLMHNYFDVILKSYKTTK